MLPWNFPEDTFGAQPSAAHPGQATGSTSPQPVKRAWFMRRRTRAGMMDN